MCDERHAPDTLFIVAEEDWRLFAEDMRKREPVATLSQVPYAGSRPPWPSVAELQERRDEFSCPPGEWYAVTRKRAEMPPTEVLQDLVSYATAASRFQPPRDNLLWLSWQPWQPGDSKRICKGRRDDVLGFGSTAVMVSAEGAKRLRHGLARRRPRLEAWYLSASEEDIMQWLEPSTRSGRWALSEARRWRTEHELEEWIVRQNRDRGVAPMTCQVLEHLNSRTTEPAAWAAESLPPCEAHMQKRSWLRRFRRRWGMSLARFPCQETLPLDTRRRKVPVLGPDFGPILSYFLDPFRLTF